MNRDRGTIKWSAMMLPEHVKLLREWQEEDKIITQPQLDEAQLEQININLQRAYTEHCAIQLKVWEQTGLYTVSGAIQKISIHEQYVKLTNSEKIHFHHIYEALLDE
ncbi:YolD-like family protein [Solibacillus sp. FSL W7-1324]|uniref:YolD-like family protein n=1 Tax=Solibacillus sp. FSL W7-1324 TaxID=2921701 RepID=UPI0030F7D865